MILRVWSLSPVEQKQGKFTYNYCSFTTQVVAVKFVLLVTIHATSLG